MKALIVADGDMPSAAAVARILGDVAPELVIAADGGALKATVLGLAPQLVVGDADSLSPAAADELRRAGAEVVVHPAAKNESDTELAVREAVRRGASTIVVIGAFGGARLEHTVANLLLLALPDLRGLDVCLADGASTVRLLEPDAPLTITGEPGDYVSLLPLTPSVDGVTTSGLEFPLSDEPLHQGPARGLSNQMSDQTATVTLRSGRLLIIHTRGER